MLALNKTLTPPLGVFFIYLKSSRISLLFFSLSATILVYLDKNDIDIIILMLFLLLTTGNSDIKNYVNAAY